MTKLENPIEHYNFFHSKTEKRVKDVVLEYIKDAYERGIYIVSKYNELYDFRKPNTPLFKAIENDLFWEEYRKKESERMERLRDIDPSIFPNKLDFENENTKNK